MKGPKGTTSYVAAWLPDRFSEAIYDVVILWAAVHATGGSAGWAGLLVGLSSVPLLAATLVGGAFGDHHGAWAVSRATLLARVGVFAILLISLITQSESIAVGAVVLAALGGPLVDGFHTPAMNSLAGFLGTEGDSGSQGELQGAVASTNQLARAIGAPLAGALVILWAPITMVCAIVGTLLSWALFRKLQAHLRAGAFRNTDNHRRSLKATFKATRRQLSSAWSHTFARNPPMQARLTVLAVSNMVSVGPFLLAIPLKSDNLHWSWWGYAVAVGLFGIGAICGGLSVNGTRKAIGSASLAVSIGILLPTCGAMAVVGLTSSAAVVGAAMAVAGYCFAISSALIFGDLNGGTADEFRGAVSSIVDLAIFGLIPIGQIAYGIVVDVTSVRTAGVAFAVATALLLLALAGRLVLRRHEPSLSSSPSRGSAGRADLSGTGPNQ